MVGNHCSAFYPLVGAANNNGKSFVHIATNRPLARDKQSLGSTMESLRCKKQWRAISTCPKGEINIGDGLRRIECHGQGITMSVF